MRENVMGRYGSRKFLLTLLVILAATGLRAFELLDGMQWVTAACGSLTVYLTGNVAQKAVVEDKP